MYPFLSDFNKILIFSTDVRKILKYQISSKSVQSGLHARRQADEVRQADMTMLVVAFRNSANPPKNVNIVCLHNK
jgi:hypothetical protein